MNQFIFDFETLSQNMLDCPVVDCSFVAFDPKRFDSDNPYTFDELLGMVQYAKLNVEHQVKEHKYKINKKTLGWWLEQDAKVRNRLKPNKNDLTLKQFVDTFLSYINKEGPIKYWWSRSNVFDPIILYRLFSTFEAETNELNNILKWWYIRDTRTYIDAKLNFPVKNAFIPTKNIEEWESKFEEHNSSHDIVADILRMQMITRYENQLEE